MSDEFGCVVERCSGDSVKWNKYGDDVLPLWVADMDFVSPQPIRRALRERVQHGIFGYGFPPPALVEILCERITRLYEWQVTPEQIHFLPGSVCALNVVCRAIGKPGDGVLVQTPIYPPFLSAPVNQGRDLQTAELICGRQGAHLYYSIDADALEAAITPHSCLFLLCHPHNPTGRLFDTEELTRLAAICARHDLVICSDEVHCDLVLDGKPHRPLASLSPDIAERCITLMAPSKSFNIAGLGISFAIVQNPTLLRQLKTAAEGIVPYVNVLGYQAAIAAYRDCDDWLAALRVYLAGNRNYLLDYLASELPGIRTTRAEATYLAWLDCRQIGIPGNPSRFFLKSAKVALNDGETFGPGGTGFVRLNFGCPRSTLARGLERMKKAFKDPCP